MPPRRLGRVGKAGGLLCRRQGEGEHGAPALAVALGPDAAPVGLDDSLADGEPQAGPHAVPLIALGAEEPAEEVGQPLGGHPHAVVGHRDGNVHPFHSGAHPDGGRLGGVARRVGQQVGQHLLHAAPVRQCSGQVRR